jgi:rhodanese-related sulfurtransferase
MNSGSCTTEPRSANSRFARAEAPSGHEPHRVPTIDRDGELRIDPWWGSIQPASLHPRIPTWGERELIEHLESGGLTVDTRRPEYVAESGTIPGAVPVPWEEITDHLELFDSGVVALFCNGPQCAATPRAVERLLDAGVPPERLAYYRGGLQDWMGLGLPVVAAEEHHAAR